MLATFLKYRIEFQFGPNLTSPGSFQPRSCCLLMDFFWDTFLWEANSGWFNLVRIQLSSRCSQGFGLNPPNMRWIIFSSIITFTNTIQTNVTLKTHEKTYLCHMHAQTKFDIIAKRIDDCDALFMAIQIPWYGQQRTFSRQQRCAQSKFYHNNPPSHCSVSLLCVHVTKKEHTPTRHAHAHPLAVFSRTP